MKILLCPDSFKGSLSAREAAAIMEQAVKSVLPDAETLALPLADGGEGTIDCLAAERIPVRACDPFGREIEAFYGRLKGQALIESAAAIGLPLVGERKDPMHNSSFGLGRLIGEALDRGERDLLLCLGGSATSDGGTGALAALGAVFSSSGEPIPFPTGSSLMSMDHIDLSGLDRRLGETRLTILSDVTNPLYGENGAACVFAPQKGADKEDAAALDRGLRNLADLLKNATGTDVSALAGGGAAGGIAASFHALFTAPIQSGIHTLLELTDFDEKVKDADLVLTGEGCFDSQSAGGKAVGGVAARARKQGVPTVVLAGAVKDFEHNGLVTAVFPIGRYPLPLSDAIAHSEPFLFETTKNVIRLFAAGR